MTKKNTSPEASSFLQQLGPGCIFDYTRVDTNRMSKVNKMLFTDALTNAYCEVAHRNWFN
ncbi:MAG: hypothetical protein KDC93_15110 [Cyclobacteriaceae bacterium]|nr:hypothetical protein [Cyclobacteriaceae bacterium]